MEQIAVFVHHILRGGEGGLKLGIMGRELQRAVIGAGPNRASPGLASLSAMKVMTAELPTLRIWIVVVDIRSIIRVRFTRGV